MAPINRSRSLTPRSWREKHEAVDRTDDETDYIFIPYLFGRCKISKSVNTNLDRHRIDSSLHQHSISRRQQLRCHRYSSRRKSSLTGKKPVVFLVGVTLKQKFTVHPYTLASRSDVFFQMLMTGPRWSTEKPIEIIDVTPAAFNLLLLSITEVDGVKGIQGRLTPALALETYYAAHKYNLAELGEFLETYIKRNSTHANILELLCHAELYGLRVLEGFCWSVIERKALLIMRSEGFERIKWDHLCAILENSRLAIREFEIFQAVMRWCAMESKRRHNNGKKSNEVLGVAVKKIRYPLLSRSEFKEVKWSKLLSSEQIYDLECNFRKNTTFCNKPRKYDCYCRRMKLDCVLCTENHNNVNDGSGLRVAAVDGRQMKRKLPVSKSSSPSSTPGSQSQSSNSNENGNYHNNYKSKSMVICECIKYSSCPAFPNGSAASIMVAKKINA